MIENALVFAVRIWEKSVSLVWLASPEPGASPRETWRSMVADMTDERDRQKFEAGWRAGAEACAKQDEDIATLGKFVFEGTAEQYRFSAGRHRQLTPPAAQPAEEGKP